MREYTIRTANGVTTVQLSDDEARKRGLVAAPVSTKPMEPAAAIKVATPANKARRPASKSSTEPTAVDEG